MASYETDQQLQIQLPPTAIHGVIYVAAAAGTTSIATAAGTRRAEAATATPTAAIFKASSVSAERLLRY